jgi:hypothetical protein
VAATFSAFSECIEKSTGTIMVFISQFFFKAGATEALAVPKSTKLRRNKLLNTNFYNLF